MLRRIILTAFVLLSSLIGRAQKTIYVLSDIHVMGPSLLVNDGTAWQNYLASQRKLIDYSTDLFDIVVDEMKTTRPDMLLITGDLTKDGEYASHEYVKNRLDELKALGIDIYVIPGNHDRGEQSGSRSFDGSSYTKVPTFNNEQFKSYYADYGYNSDIQDPNSLSYVCEPFPGLCLIGIDSGVDGVLSEATIDWVCQKAADARNNGLKPVAMMHHALVPHITNANAFVSTFVVNQNQVGDQSYEAIKDRFIEAGISVIFTGHFHVSDIAVDYDSNDTSGSPVYDISTGSTIAYPCDYRVITVDDEFTSMDIVTKTIDTLEGVDDFKDIAKERLRASIENIAYNKIDALAKEKLSGVLYNMYSFLNYSRKLALLIADAYVEHGEGNENENEDAVATMAELDSNFKLAENMGVSGMKGIKDMIHSMLQDRSPFGTGRENITNDRTLHIDGLVNWPDNLAVLFNDTDNSSVLQKFDSQTCDVVIYGRSFVKDGYWNTLCLPFSLDETAIDNSSLADATIAELSEAVYNTDRITFEFDVVNSIEAGKPYILKFPAEGDVNEESMVKNNRMRFSNVTISNQVQPLDFGLIGMTGMFSPVAMTPNNKTVRFVGKQNYIYYPTDDAPVNSFRAYFTLDESIAANVKSFSFDIDNTTGVVEIDDDENRLGDEWFDVNGRRVTQPLQKGVYINSNRKYVIK